MNSSTMRIGRQLLVGLAFASLLVVLMPVRALAQSAAPEGELAAARSKATSLYTQGKLLTAIAGLRQAAKARSSEVPTREVNETYAVLVDMCTELRDAPCLFEAADTLRTLWKKPTSKEDERYLLYLVTAALFYAGQLPESALSFLEKVGPQSIDPVTEPLLYVKFSLLAAEILAAKERPQLARVWLNAGLSVLLAHGQFDDYNMSAGLLRAIKIMLDLEQYPRAVYYWTITETYLRTVLRSNSMSAAMLHYVVFRTAEHIGISTLTESSARAGIDALASLELPGYLADFYREQFASGAAASCAIAENYECAKYFLGQHPLGGREDALLSRDGSFVSLSAAQYALISALTTAFGGNKPNPAWRDAFERIASAPTTKDNATAKAYAAWILGTYEILERPDSTVARDYWIEAMRLRLRELGHTEGDSSTWFWLPDSYDRLILWSAAVNVAHREDPSIEERKLAVQAIDLANRSARYFGVNALGALAGFSSPEKQAQMQAFSQVLVRFGAWEKKRLQALFGSPNSKARTDPEELKNGGNVRLQYTQLLEQIDQLEQVLPEEARRIVPDLGAVQSLLRPGEVIVTRATFAGSTGFACIRQDGIRMTKAKIGDPATIKQAVLDLRLLYVALTDDRAPSKELDSQFPFASSERVHQWLFAPVARDCAKKGERIIWVDSSQSMFPVHALSADSPPGKDGFYDLAKATWVGRDYAFSYVVSLSHFVAARRESRKGDLATAYLGVGNPVLSGKTADGTTFGEKLAARSARSATAGLVSLIQLPETEKEILGLSQKFSPTGRTVLLGNEATEAKFRRQVLTRYGLIHFATHGVIGEELPGLTEPALVLTPVSEKVQANDGLLTATEISQLALRARLVVLSACNTANFSVTTFGNEFQGLSTAFLLAGTPSMMLTLWPVDSSTSETIVSQAVAVAMDSGTPIDKALSRALFAQAATSGNPAYFHPRFWAPFVIFGDGATTITERSVATDDNIEVQAQVFDTFDGGGELYSVVPIPGSGDLLISGFAGLESGRFKSLVQRISPQGDVRWRKQDSVIAGGRAILWNSSALVAGYVSDSNRMRSVLTRLSLDGAPIWQVRILPENDTFVLAMSSRGSEADVLAVEPRLQGDKLQASLLRISDDGSVRKAIPIPLPRASNPASGVIFTEGNNSVVLVSVWADFTGERKWTDRYSMVRYCLGERSTIRVVISNETDEVLSRTSVTGSSFYTTAPLAGTNYLAADAYDACGPKSIARVVSIAADGKLSDIYQAPHDVSSELRTLNAWDGSRLVGLGSTTLRIDADDARGMDRLPIADDLLLEQAGTLVRWFVLTVDPRNKRSRAYPFSVGSSMQLSSSVVSGGEVIAAGAVGGHPALIRVRPPRN